MPERGTETTEFSHAFHQETDALMRRRLVWFICLWGGLNALGLVALIVVQVATGTPSLPGLDTTLKAVGFVGMMSSWALAYGLSLFLVLWRSLATRDVVRLSIGLIVLDGLVFIGGRAMDIPLLNLSSFWLSHLIACIVFPWRVKESLLPIAIVVPIGIASALTIEADSVGSVVTRTIFLLLFLTPAVMLCWWKHSQRLVRASNRFLHQRYGMLRQELAYARQVHESLFPAPIAEGPVRFAYKYEPMRQIGGDYLHAHVTDSRNGEPGAVSVVVLDVTGHGIPAALSVNRLHGEIDLRFADDPDIGPGQVLARLNRYINLTLSRHSIYATALCLRVDPVRGVVEYASGGHPPGFLLGADGTIEELGSTALVLGATKEADYDPGEVTIDFREGDTLVVYTDGAVEARSPKGRMLRIAGLRDALMASRPEIGGGRPGLWPDHLLTLVTNHRAGGPPEDDTLIVELHRPINERVREAGAVSAEAGALG